MLGAQPGNRLPVIAQRAHQHRHARTGPGVIEYPTRNLRIGRTELDRMEMRIGRHDPHGAQRAVGAIGAELEKPARRAAPDRGIQDGALLVAHAVSYTHLTLPTSDLV